MVFVADKDDGAIFAGEFQGFKVDFSHQRASSVDHFERARSGFIANRRRDAVGAEDEHCAVRDFVNGFYKDGAAAAELFDDISVVDNFVVHVNRRAVGFERQLNYINGADNARAEASRPHP
jgi:hypothetical protein